MKRIIKISILFVFCCNIQVQAQNEVFNLQKYWFYHHRLVNDFLIKGEDAGCSIPMTERYYLENQLGQWSDATISLANYISVLATEYRLLRDNSQPTDTTLQELYLAIKAFNRLDYTAESYFRCPTCPPNPLSSDLNGFFIRDDVPATFLADHPGQLSSGVVSTYNINAIGSDMTSSNPLDKEMSHDQIWHLFIGFALVSEMLDDNPNYKGLPLNEVDGNIDIRQEAKNITDRIMNHIRNQDGPASLKWTIINPVTNNNVARGAFIAELSYGAAEAACFIRNGNTTLNALPPAHTCNEYHDLVSLADAPVWQLFGTGVGSLIAISAEDNKVQNLAAVGSSWRSNAIPVLAINQTAVKLGVRAILRDYQHLSVLHQVLHGGPNPIEESTYFNLVNAAPCTGPYNFGYPSEASGFEYSTENRFLYPQRRGEDPDGTDRNVFKGEYNGLDYMLIHNLFYIVTGTSPNYINYMDRVITLPFPTGPLSDIGTLSNPLTVNAFHTITASNIVNDNAGVTYRAGTEVRLLPGFEAHAGANFHAYVEPFDCALGDTEFRSAVNNTNGSPEAPTENLVACTTPTTYVYYPNVNKPANSETLTNNSLANSTSTGSNSLGNNGISITPNPNNGSFQISVTKNNDPTGINEIKVYDIMGKVIWETGASSGNLFTIDITSYSEGIYYVKCINEFGDMEMKKLIKQ